MRNVTARANKSIIAKTGSAVTSQCITDLGTQTRSHKSASQTDASTEQQEHPPGNLTRLRPIDERFPLIIAHHEQRNDRQ